MSRTDSSLTTSESSWRAKLPENETPGSSEGRRHLNRKFEPAPPVVKLTDVRDIKLGSIANSDAAKLLWQKLYFGLLRSNRFTVAAAADGNSVWLSGTLAFGSTESAYDRDVVAQLTQKGTVLWKEDIERAEARLWNTTSMIADAIIASLTQQAEQTEKAANTKDQ